jgi:hypothetical protein
MARLFAVILALQAAWLLSAEFTRPTLPYFPESKADQDMASAARSSAETAARIGWLRGDLWTDAAITAWSALADRSAGERDRQIALGKDHARAIAGRAIRWSPHESRAWLLVAALDSEFDWSNDKAVEPLKMSYFTGPNEIELAPLRIRLATRSTAITDVDLQSLTSKEIRSILLQHPDQKGSVLTAYRQASPEGKKFIEVTVRDLDKDLLATMRATGGRQ